MGDVKCKREGDRDRQVDTKQDRCAVHSLSFHVCSLLLSAIYTMSFNAGNLLGKISIFLEYVCTATRIRRRGASISSHERDFGWSPISVFYAHLHDKAFFRQCKIFGKKALSLFCYAKVMRKTFDKVYDVATTAGKVHEKYFMWQNLRLDIYW